MASRLGEVRAGTIAWRLVRVLCREDLSGVTTVRCFAQHVCFQMETNLVDALLALLRFNLSSGRRDANVRGWRLMASECKAWGKALL